MLHISDFLLPIDGYFVEHFISSCFVLFQNCTSTRAWHCEHLGQRMDAHLLFAAEQYAAAQASAAAAAQYYASAAMTAAAGEYNFVKNHIHIHTICCSEPWSILRDKLTIVPCHNIIYPN